MLNHALKYLRMGLSVIPLQPRGKDPLISWKKYQEILPMDNDIRSWWSTWPFANIGIVTGTVSGIAIVDLDGPEGMSQASLMKLSSSVISLTGNGKHLWYRNPVGVTVQNAVRICPGMDIRGEGGYIVAPPSIHESGRRYRWLNPLILSKLGAFPMTLLNVQPVKPNETYSKSDSWIAEALNGMAIGNIDDTLFTLCSRLRADNYSANDALVLLRPHAERAGATPGHLEDKIENVWSRYSPNEKYVRNEPNEKKTSITGIELGLHSDKSSLVIHSPARSESWKEFQTRSQTTDSGGLQTGYPKLDAMLKGGIKSSRLFTIAARTGVGKTNWLLGVTKRLCLDGKRVLLFSTEMPYTQIWERYISTLKASEEFTKHQFYVCDSFAPNLERVEEAINEIKPDVFMFDHINHISEEQKELGHFMQGLNYLRRKYACAGIVTAQLNRAADWVDLKTGERVLPRMSMIKGSGTIEQASSRVLLLSETRVTDQMTEIVGNLDKNDDGPKGLVHFGLMTKPYRMVEL